MVRAMSDPRDRMKAFINRIAPVPPLSDPADAISASLVAGAIAFLLVSVILFVIVSAAAGRMPAVYALTLPIGIVLLVTLRWVLRRGHVRSAAYALCAFGWLLVAVDVQQRGPDTLSVGGFIVLTVIGGLTLGPRGTVALTAATVALLALFLLGFVHGPFTIPTSSDRLVHYTTQLVLAGSLSAWWAMRTRRLLRELRQSEARRTLLLEASPDAIVSSDARGVITFQNRATEQMLGYPATELVGRPWHELPPMRGADVGRLMFQFAATVEEGIHHPPEELTLIHRDGHDVVVDVKGVALYEDGTIVGTVSNFREITARKKAEAERTLLQRQLVSAQRMEAMGLVAGGVAHDFNNLLTVILAAAETSDPESLGDVREAARRGVALTRQLLAFSGRKPSDPRPTDINQAITAISPMLARLLGATVNLDVRLAAQAGNIVIDAGQLDQVIVNLAANGRDAMPNGGTLTISTDSKAGRVELRVGDTGLGMDASTLASAFEPFFTTKGDRGTGLGLAVVQNIVREAHGTVTCTTEPGLGTKFTLNFPASAGVQAPPASHRGGTIARSRRVVFVDDNALVRRGIVRVLERGGFVVDAFDGAQDVSAIEASLAGADALITDLVMPGRSGVDLAIELRSRNCQVPIVFVSGYAEHSLLARIREVSCSSLLEKPFTLQDLVERLGELQDTRAQIDLFGDA